VVQVSGLRVFLWGGYKTYHVFQSFFPYYEKSSGFVLGAFLYISVARKDSGFVQNYLPASPQNETKPVHFGPSVFPIPT
jgi:hypothetical protein